MRPFVNSVMSVFALLVAAQSAAADVSVTDGDGLRIGDERIRLWGIDAPELEQTCQRNGAAYACGEKSRAALSHLVVQGQISCETVEWDRYGRTVARCSVNGEDLGAGMVRASWAVNYQHYSDGAYPRERLRPAWRNAPVGRGV